MSKSKFVIDRLAKLFEQGLISSKDLADEIMTILKSKRDEIVFRMKLTSKDEFEILSKRVENLEKTITKLKTKNTPLRSSPTLVFISKAFAKNEFEST